MKNGGGGGGRGDGLSRESEKERGATKKTREKDEVLRVACKKRGRGTRETRRGVDEGVRNIQAKGED